MSTTLIDMVQFTVLLSIVKHWRTTFGQSTS